jgi:hypothetical protein
MEYFSSTANVEITNQTIISVTGYTGTTGPLSFAFNETSGIFTSPSDNGYLSIINVNFRRPEGTGLGVDDGLRQVSSLYQNGIVTNINLGQSVWVVNGPTGSLYEDFSVNSSAGGVIYLPTGFTSAVTLYQDNTNDNTITARVKFSIIKLTGNNI